MTNDEIIERAITCHKCGDAIKLNFLQKVVLKSSIWVAKKLGTSDTQLIIAMTRAHGH